MVLVLAASVGDGRHVEDAVMSMFDRTLSSRGR